MTSRRSILSSNAAQDFRQARRQAALKNVLARLTGKSIGLLSYEDVRAKLKARTTGALGLKEISLDAIIGSVGRYSDFTRDFLPRQDTIEDRWVRVKVAVTELSNMPPIEVYKIGEAYFVVDGNHRVSVARQMGAKHIQAYVTELKTKVSLTPDVQPIDLIIKAEYAEFLERTRLDELRKGADLNVTIPGKYQLLEEQIQTHRYFLGEEQNREVPYGEAVTHWYDTIYAPVIMAIRGQGIMREFPNRTETDLYLWVTKHRTRIEEELEWDIGLEAAASNLAEQYSNRPERVVTRIGGKILDTLLPDELEAGPPPGEWRRMKKRQKPEPQAETRLFLDLLVPIPKQLEGWQAVEQAILIAQREGARLHGLHVVSDEEEKDRASVLAMKEEFEGRCAAAGIAGDFAVTVGSIARQICDRARWVDLVILNLAHPPGPQPASRLSSGFGTLIRRCPRPILAVPGKTSPLSSALLAYDGSPKGREALYVAAYLAAQWRIPLVALTVSEEGKDTEKILQSTSQYLNSGSTKVTFIETRGEVGAAILAAARDQKSELLIMGGYGHRPVMEVMLGSAVDQVLREADFPVLICR